MKPSTGGRLGAGLYLTVQDVAMKIAKHRGHGDSVYVIEVEVDVGNIKTLVGEDEDTIGKWRSQRYDTCRSLHPAWIVNHAFPEWCVADSSRAKIIGMQQIGGITKFSGNIHGTLSVNDGTIIVKNGPTSTIKTTGTAVVKTHGNGSIQVSSNGNGSTQVCSRGYGIYSISSVSGSGIIVNTNNIHIRR